jgi:hypothetical protein
MYVITNSYIHKIWGEYLNLILKIIEELRGCGIYQFINF